MACYSCCACVCGWVRVCARVCVCVCVCCELLFLYKMRKVLQGFKETFQRMDWCKICSFSYNKFNTMHPPLLLLLCLKLAVALSGRAEPYTDVSTDVMTWLVERHWPVEKQLWTSTSTSPELEPGSRWWKRDFGQTACRAARNSIWAALHHHSLIIQSFIVTISDSGAFLLVVNS